MANKNVNEMVNRFILNIFHCSQPKAIIISKIMKRYLDKMETTFYYRDIIISSHNQSFHDTL